MKVLLIGAVLLFIFVLGDLIYIFIENKRIERQRKAFNEAMRLFIEEAEQLYKETEEGLKKAEELRKKRRPPNE